MRYKETPPEVMELIDLFYSNNLNYILFKCEHIFEGTQKNVDILFTDEDYHRAARLLEYNGFVLRFSEKFEKYKLMYFRYKDAKCVAIHLHREVAWHGIKVLDKSKIFERKKALSKDIIVPSEEDYILIHAGHILFENFEIAPREKAHFDNYETSDKEYIDLQLETNGWKSGFNDVLSGNLSKTSILKSWISKLMFDPVSAFNLSIKIIKKLFSVFDPRSKGLLISLSGTNGSGKSTLSRELVKQYSSMIPYLGVKSELVYQGWRPAFFLTKLISKSFKKKEVKVFEKSIKTKKLRVNLFQELLFVYIYLEYLYRYLVEILPLLKKNTLVITDRYFYDIYGQYPYAKKSILLKLLFFLFPKPNYSYVLDVPTNILGKRDKTDKDSTDNVTLKRNAFPEEYLQDQRDSFKLLAERIGARIIDTSQDSEMCAKSILNDFWKSLR